VAANSVESILKGAKDTLASANRFTESVVGNPTNAFAPKKIEAPKLPAAHEYAHTPYSIAHKASGLADEARSAGEGIKARMETEAATRKVIE
jgi:hypothetical protein